MGMSPHRPWKLGALAWLAAGLCILPLVAVLISALSGGFGTVSGLAQTVLPRYAGNTLLLCFIVGTGTAFIGTGAAWLVTATRFPGRRVFEIALALPLTYPAYVLAYAYTDLLDHPGWVQTTLRDLTGWGPRDYWFPEIRSLGGAAAMLTFVLYPYVYLLARASFLRQSSSAFTAARALGQGPWRAFFRVSVPVARPAIAGGVLLALMETLADYGTVAYFSIESFSTAIVISARSLADRPAASQLALCLLAFALTLALLERAQRKAAKHHDAGRRFERMEPLQLKGWRSAGAILFCALPVFLGFLLPTLVLIELAWGSERLMLQSRYLGFLRNSVTLAGIGAVLTVGAAIAIGTNLRLNPTAPSLAAARIAGIGYAVPGFVIGAGLLFPFAAFDNALDAFMEARFGIDTGLLITGSIWLLIIAYMVRFMAVALNAYESGLSTLNANVDAAARSLGASPGRMMRRVHLPILRPSILTALLIVFVDIMKELPATLMLRPFGMETLAVQVHNLAADERLREAAVPSLVIGAVGLLPVALLCWTIGRESRGARPSATKMGAPAEGTPNA